jgi:hypothetical protein
MSAFKLRFRSFDLFSTHSMQRRKLRSIFRLFFSSRLYACSVNPWQWWQLTVIRCSHLSIKGPPPSSAMWPTNAYFTARYIPSTGA